MWLAALLLGLLGSFHCVGMCGPIAFMLPVDRSNTLRKTSQIFTYHFGRILAYALLGLLFGLLGKGLYLFGFQQQLSIVIGVLMIAMVVIPPKTLQTYRITRPIYGLISKIKSALGSALHKKTADAFLTIGFLNGFLPCGLVYIAVFGAIASGNAAEGSLYMAVFGLGTIPMMTAAIYLGSILTAKVRQRIRRAIPVFIVVIGCLFILRGMGLGIPYVSPKLATEKVGASLECHEVSEPFNTNSLK